MAIEGLNLRGALVLGSGLVYWLGVWIQARRVRHRIGHSPNVRPRGLKEKVLWAGWSFVVVSWVLVPFLSKFWWASPIQGLVGPGGLIVGAVLLVIGYGITLWCYAAMGDAWRMGVIRSEKPELVSCGPFRFIRHPIYLCQSIMLIGVAILIPSVLCFVIVLIHFLCASIKAADEESHLRGRLGESYKEYCLRTGRWLPRLLKARPRSALPAVEEGLKPAQRPSK
jgi:isoprenylcysteine carboxyl methyltransferase (ICMT) family protein YpbQ